MIWKEKDGWNRILTNWACIKAHCIDFSWLLRNFTYSIAYEMIPRKLNIRVKIRNRKKIIINCSMKKWMLLQEKWKRNENIIIHLHKSIDYLFVCWQRIA